MFSFFKRKSGEIKIQDRIYRTRASMMEAIRQMHSASEDLTIICWFDGTIDEVEQTFKSAASKPQIFQAREASAQHLTGRNIIFIEHYPLAEKETALLEKLHLQQASFYSSLEDPLFRHFGGERIATMMDQLGMQENEVIQHKLVTSSIRNAQEKLSKKVTVEQSARSQAEWFQRNL